MPDELQFHLHGADDERDGGSLEFQATRPPATNPAGTGPARQRVIVKVRETGYVPHGFDVRTRIDELLFTAEASPSALKAASADPAVETISAARRLHPDDAGPPLG